MKKLKLIRQVAVAFAIVFMSAVLCGAGCSNVASDSGGGSSGGGGVGSGGGGASSTMTEAEAIAAIKALQSGGSITIVLGSSVTTISYSLKEALRDPNKKVTLDLSQSGMTSIGDIAFYGCSSLRSVEIPSGVTSIGEGAFYDCSSLTSVEIPSGVTSINTHLFKGCSSLTSVEIPCSVTSIGVETFKGCTSLNTIKYTGSKSDWNAKLSFSAFWRYDVPALGVTCSDGKKYAFVGAHDSSGTANHQLDAEI